MRAPWRQVGHSRPAMAAAVVLMFYIVIGLLDSLHFRPALEGTALHGKQYATDVHSVLDVMAGHLRAHTEKTYSAPLATHSFAKELITLPDGSETRDFPRLAYGGSHLVGQSRSVGADITMKTLTGLALGVLLWLALSACVILLLAQSHRENFRTVL